MHQDYSEELVFEEDWPSEEKSGEIIIKRLLAGGKGHYGCLEHPQIILNCGWFPHSTISQIRTHRVGVSFDVQSLRYTGNRIVKVADGLTDPDQVFYLRPVGQYRDRKGARYDYTLNQRNDDLRYIVEACKRYAERVAQGFSEEHARGLIPYDIRQCWVMSANVRSILHMMDLRYKEDAQLECQMLCAKVWPIIKDWVPAVAEWYEKNRLHKNKIAP